MYMFVQDLDKDILIYHFIYSKSYIWPFYTLYDAKQSVDSVYVLKHVYLILFRFGYYPHVFFFFKAIGALWSPPSVPLSIYLSIC